MARGSVFDNGGYIGVKATFGVSLADRDRNTIALLHFNGSNGSQVITDSSWKNNNWTAVGTTALSTTRSRFGTASITNTSTNSYLYPNSNTDFNFGTGDFTIEFWVWATGNTNFFFDTTPAGAGYQQFIFIENTGDLMYYSSGAVRIQTPWTSVYGYNNAWRHIAVSRASGTTRMFVDGTQVGATYTGDTTNWSMGSQRPIIAGFGTSTGNAYTLQGFMDEFRASNIARYTANFTPSTAEFGG